MLRLLFALLGMLLVAHTALAAELTVEDIDGGKAVKIDGQPFAEYLVKSGSKPIVWPIYGPTGQRMTRSWPMEEVESEKDRDHIHQRSLWFTHGDVNGIDFWSEGKGRIEHREFVEAKGGPEAVIVTRNDWRSPNDNTRLLQDQRTFTFGGDAEQRWIDVALELIASDGPVVFGDTKEGSFGVRVPSSIRVESRQGGKIVNSDGLTNLFAWGKPAAWVDYHGPVDGETLGVAILNHPSSFRYPTPWHVRTYGLFAANPFGLGDFSRGKEKGQHILPEGETLKLRYRVLLHKGDEKAGRVAEVFSAYAQ